MSKDYHPVTEIIVITEGFGYDDLMRAAKISGTKVYILPTKTPEERKKCLNLLIGYGVKEVK